MAYKCLKCSANLSFDISNNNLKCDYCKSNYDIPKNHIINNYIIPFKVEKQLAIQLYKKLIKSKLLTPSQFKKHSNINKIEGAYIPFEICDMDISGSSEYKANKISSWKSSGKKYEKVDVYSVIRDGSMALKNVPVSCCKSFKDDIVDTLGDYIYEDKVLYDPSYFNNYKVYKTDKTNEDVNESIKSRAKSLFSYELMNDIKGYVSIKNVDSKVKLKVNSITYILLPVWVLNFNYKNKKHAFYINGQTGQIVGQIPVLKNKLLKLWIILFIIIFLLLVFINIMKVVFL